MRPSPAASKRSSKSSKSASSTYGTKAKQLPSQRNKFEYDITNVTGDGEVTPERKAAQNVEVAASVLPVSAADYSINGRRTRRIQSGA